MSRSPHVLTLTLLLALLPTVVAARARVAAGELDGALASVEEASIRATVAYLASSKLEGRDSPSPGLELAARSIAERFAAAGLAPAPDSLKAWARVVEEPAPEWARAGEAGVWLRPYWGGSDGSAGIVRPDPERCSLELDLKGEPTHFELGVDYVPIEGCAGDIRGELVFGGFGIVSKDEHYNDLKGARLAGRVVLIFDGEPRHKKRFEGEEVTGAGSLWNKLKTLADERVGGVLVVRRPEPEAEQKPRGSKDAPQSAPARLGFRHTEARWQGEPPDRKPNGLPPALEISPACADAILGVDALELARKIDKSVRPIKQNVDDRKVSLSSATERGRMVLHNLLAWIPGRDLAEEVVVLGAHYDHIGVGARGRIGHGADDNASGTAALCELAEALAGLRPRRSILLAAFSAEEDGLIGSEGLCADLPVPARQIVAMLNLDMIGRGPTDEVVVLGLDQNPGMSDVLNRARKLGRSGIKSFRPCSDRGLFARSDHFSFHKLGIPTVFLFENYPLEKNPDYHTWRDTLERVDIEKIANTARFALCTAWILANDDDRLPSPRG